MADTKIEWCDKTWNPVSGCTKVSAGCKNCWAERMSKRLAGRCGYPEDGFKVTLHPEKLDEPLRWKKPSKIFVCSMGDLFHAYVSLEFLTLVMVTIEKCKHHTFLILTKRPERMLGFIRGVYDMTGAMPPENLWLGVSVEDQKTADERIPLLLQTPAAKRFVSYEPVLSGIDLANILVPVSEVEERHEYAQRLRKGLKFNVLTTSDEKHYYNPPAKLDWIIQGGESGSGARPMHPDWARSVRDQCKATGVPFWFKQWGEWAEMQCEPGGDLGGDMRRDAVRIVKEVGDNDGHFKHGDVLMRRVGKRAAGCLLDGKEHKETP